MGSGQANRIRARRLTLRMTQLQVARAVGVSRIAVHHWETSDTVEIKGSNLRRLAKALQCPESDLVEGGHPEVAPARNGSQVALDAALLTMLLSGLEHGLQGQPNPPSPEKRANLISGLYEVLSKSRVTLSQDEIVTFIRRAL